LRFRLQSSFEIMGQECSQREHSIEYLITFRQNPRSQAEVLFPLKQLMLLIPKETRFSHGLHRNTGEELNGDLDDPKTVQIVAKKFLRQLLSLVPVIVRADRCIFIPRPRYA